MTSRIEAFTESRRLITCGDSISINKGIFGTGISVAQHTVSGTGVPLTEEAVGGSTALFALNRLGYVTRHFSKCISPIVLIVTGTNSYAVASASGADVYGSISDIAESVKTTEPTTLCYATTCVPSDTITGGEDTARLAGNALILADADGFLDGVIDWAAESSLQVPSQDGTHFGVTQRAYAGSLCQAVIFP